MEPTGDADMEEEEEFAEPTSEALHAEGEGEGEDEEEEFAEGEGDGEGEGEEESPRVYRNVPTWEEAISFLLHRRPGESGSRESRSREPRRDGGRHSDPEDRSHN